MVGKTDKNTTLYWQDRVDSRKLALEFISKLWVVILGALLGAVLGCILYFGYHAVADEVKYEAVSEFYLDFAADETGEVYQYYNGYTWNDLMSTDLIATETLNAMTVSGVDLARLKADTKAEILSDIRVLRVTISDSDAQICNDLQKATEKSLEKLGNTAKEFNDISTIKSTEATRVYVDNRLPQAAELGAIIGLILTLIVLWFRYILDDTIMVPTDLKGLGVSVLGIRCKNSDEKLAVLLDKLCSNNEEFAISKELGSDVAATDIIKIDASSFQNLNVDGDFFDNVGKARGVIIEVPFGKVRKCVLELLIDSLTLHEVNIYGVVIKEADNKFYTVYYQLLPGRK